mmetsp:Transcript_9730/g.28055  ORF Transcript_9730/g.28055 Transcript_9730/m.28055 type:complete len:134 (-) Transcript_9730:1066-1467(-)
MPTRHIHTTPRHPASQWVLTLLSSSCRISIVKGPLISLPEPARNDQRRNRLLVYHAHSSPTQINEFAGRSRHDQTTRSQFFPFVFFLSFLGRPHDHQPIARKQPHTFQPLPLLALFPGLSSLHHPLTVTINTR